MEVSLSTLYAPIGSVGIYPSFTAIYLDVGIDSLRMVPSSSLTTGSAVNLGLRTGHSVLVTPTSSQSALACAN